MLNQPIEHESCGSPFTLVSPSPIITRQLPEPWAPIPVRPAVYGSTPWPSSRARYRLCTGSCRRLPVRQRRHFVRWRQPPAAPRWGGPGGLAETSCHLLLKEPPGSGRAAPVMNKRFALALQLGQRGRGQGTPPGQRQCGETGGRARKNQPDTFAGCTQLYLPGRCPPPPVVTRTLQDTEGKGEVTDAVHRGRPAGWAAAWALSSRFASCMSAV